MCVLMPFPPPIPVGAALFLPLKEVGGHPDTNGGSPKGRKGEVPAEIRHAYINDKASMTFLGLLRFWWQAHHQLASQLCHVGDGCGQPLGPLRLGLPFYRVHEEQHLGGCDLADGWYSSGGRSWAAVSSCFP